MNKFSQWLKETQMTDVGSLVSQFLIVYVTVDFSIQANRLMAAADVGHQTIGFELAGAIIAAIILGKGINSASSYGNRKTSREWLAGQAEIEKQKATAPAAVINNAVTTAGAIVPTAPKGEEGVD